MNIRIGRFSQLVTPGHGSCFRCRTTWPFVEEHSTYFAECEACFPLCVKCWTELTPETRLPYYEELIALWEQTGPVKPGKAGRSAQRY